MLSINENHDKYSYDEVVTFVLEMKKDNGPYYNEKYISVIDAFLDREYRSAYDNNRALVDSDNYDNALIA